MCMIAGRGRLQIYPSEKRAECLARSRNSADKMAEVLCKSYRSSIVDGDGPARRPRA